MRRDDLVVPDADDRLAEERRAEGIFGSFLDDIGEGDLICTSARLPPPQ